MGYVDAMSQNDGLAVSLKKTAALARLRLSETEIQAYSDQIEKILGYVTQLAQVRVEGVVPMTHPHDLATTLRPDEAIRFGTATGGGPKVLTSASEVLYDGYKVPQILAGDG